MHDIQRAVCTFLKISASSAVTVLIDTAISSCIMHRDQEKVRELEALIAEKDDQIQILMTKIRDLESSTAAFTQVDGMNDLDIEEIEEEETESMLSDRVSDYKEDEFVDEQEESVTNQNEVRPETIILQKPYRCNICQTRTETIESMKEHIRINHGQYIFPLKNH